jgi:ankyrin repeat protein
MPKILTCILRLESRFLPQMHSFRVKSSALISLGGLLFLGVADNGSTPEARSSVSPKEFVRAVAAGRTAVVDFYLTNHLNPNGRAGQDRPLLVTAILQHDSKIVQRLLHAGACVDLADESGFSPLMAAALAGDVDLVQQILPLATNPAATDRAGRTALHYAVAGGKTAVVEILLPTVGNMMARGKDGRTAFAMALDHGNPQVIDMILDRLPLSPDWNPETLYALDTALAAGNKDQVRSLLSKHEAPPTVVGKGVPLLGHAIATNNTGVARMLLDCGADPDTVLPDKCDPDFLALLPPALRDYVTGDRGVTVLTLAAGLGQCDAVRVLLAAGADQNRATLRYKMLPLYIAGQTGKWQCMQILLGGGPAPEQLRVEISLSTQHAAVIKDGVAIFNTICSTGRSGFSTRTGDYVITDKDRDHRSTIYKVEMPYFMRLSCLDFGMHEGVVPNYPASHGCIRLPGQAARKLFAELPVGTLVSVK